MGFSELVVDEAEESRYDGERAVLRWGLTGCVPVIYCSVAFHPNT